jgi:4-alpha-glucanotransferase
MVDREIPRGLPHIRLRTVDHFRGFQAYWRVPAGDATAENGQWVSGPGERLFEAVEGALGRWRSLPRISVITPEVEAIRHRFGYPGMAILQFAFGSDPQGLSFQPHSFPCEIVAYTGTR